MNFKGRWSESLQCAYCCKLDTDEHLFSCCGYEDLFQEPITHRLFFNLECSVEELGVAARVLLGVYERLITLHDDKDMNDVDDTE